MNTSILVGGRKKKTEQSEIVDNSNDSENVTPQLCAFFFVFVFSKRPNSTSLSRPIRPDCDGGCTSGFHRSRKSGKCKAEQVTTN